MRGQESRPIAVRPCPDLKQALIATTDPALFRGETAAPWERLRAAVRLARYGCDAYAYAMAAMGSLDLVIETGLKAWDIEAAIPLIQGAGGLITDWRGDPIGPNGGEMLICGDPRVHAEAVRVLGT